MNLRPSIVKVCMGIIVVFLWVAVNFFIITGGIAMCKPCAIPVCASGGQDYGEHYLIGNGCNCTCESFSDMLASNLRNTLVPFILVYLVWSLFEKKR